MNLLDDEVFAVIMAVIVVASVFAAVQLVKPGNPEPFTAIGLLNENCKIGDYPRIVFLGENLTLCLYLDNHQSEPALFRVKYKIALNTTDLPSNETPSPEKPVAEYEFFLPSLSNTTDKIELYIPENPGFIGRELILVLELYQLNPLNMTWIYTGRWVSLHVNATEVVLP